MDELINSVNEEQNLVISNDMLIDVLEQPEISKKDGPDDMVIEEETEIIEERTTAEIGQDEEGNFFFALEEDCPEIDFNMIKSAEWQKNADGTETLVIEIGGVGVQTMNTEDCAKSSLEEAFILEESPRIMQQLFEADGFMTPAYPLGLKNRRGRQYGDFPCPECNQTFVNTARLERHLAVHQVSGSFVCPLCQKVYKYEYNLFYHWRKTCHQLAEHVSYIDRRGNDINTLRGMVLALAEKKAAEAPPPTVKLGINPILLFKNLPSVDMQSPLNSKECTVVCHECQLTFPESVMALHLAIHRNEIAVDGRSNYGDYVCSLCATIFHNHYHLIRHWRTSCTAVLERIGDQDVMLDENGLKDMVAEILRQNSNANYASSVISDSDLAYVGSSNDLLSTAEKLKQIDEFILNPDASVDLEMLNDYTGKNLGASARPVEKQRPPLIEKSKSEATFDYMIANCPSTTYSNSTIGMVECPECNRTFINAARLERHIAGFHATVGSHHCVLCGNRFRYDYNLLFHYRRSCPYTKVYMDRDIREQMEAAELRKEVRKLARRNLQLPIVHRHIDEDRPAFNTRSVRYSSNFHRPPPELLLRRPDLPTGLPCPVCGIIFYGEKAVERHMKVAHDTQWLYTYGPYARMVQQAQSEVEEELDASCDAPPTLAPEVPIAEQIQKPPAVVQVDRIEDEHGNEVLIDENGQRIEITEDDVQIEYGDYDSVKDLIESGEFTVDYLSEFALPSMKSPKKDIASCSAFVTTVPFDVDMQRTQ